MHHYHQFETTSDMERSNAREVHSYNSNKAPKEKLMHQKPLKMPGTTIPLSIAHRASDAGNNFISPNPPDVRRLCKGCKIVGIV
jgi:hypothetical protein